MAEQGAAHRAGRLWRTVRHLRARQLIGRARFRLARPRADLAPAPELRPLAGPWQPPARRAPSLTGAGQFHFLGEGGSLADHRWDGADKSKLWRYNQHYFDDLTASDAGTRAAWHQALIADWLAANPPGQGTGWEPYPTSLRIINWVIWSWAGGSLPPAAIDSLAVQARWLMRRLEWHLLGNHLFANAKALVFAGLFFAGREADGWLAQGCSILARELPEQFLPDGGQFELSPMYHALAFEDLLDLANCAAAHPHQELAALAEELRHRAFLAGQWLAAMSHADGAIAFFNDAALGIAPSNEELFAYAARLGIAPPAPLPGLTYLAASGYARLAAGEALAIVDLARIGPDYLPGHAHADTLSFELSLGRQRLFVNSGTSEYGTGPERQRQRGTAAHNTVAVVGEDSSEVWAGFRVGRRAAPFAVRTGEDGRALFAEASHDGYRWLTGAPMVHRRVELTDAGLVVEDKVSPVTAAEARYHLHPDARVELTGTGAIVALPGGRRCTLRATGGPLRLEPTSWHPEFGRSIANLCLVLPLAEGRARLSLQWG